MSKLRSIPYAVLVSGVLVSSGAYAQSMSTIDQRQDYQQDRIERGIQSGQITRSEAYRLEQGERSIDRAQARAGADGVVTSGERARLDSMTNRENRDISRQSHDSQQSWDRGQTWGRTDGRDNGWQDRNGRQGNSGQGNGWGRGQHDGRDGNGRSGIERRDARQDRRIDNGVRDGSLTHGEANRLENGQNRINRYEAHARSDGTVTPNERGRIDRMQNNEGRRISADRHNDRTATPAPTTGTRPTPVNQPSRSWSHGSGQVQQASAPPTSTHQRSR